MVLFKSLLNRFGRKDTLASLARRHDRNAFVLALAQADITLFVDPQSEGLDPADLTEEALLAEVEKAVSDLSGRDSYHPFRYVKGGMLYVPFFSSPKHAQTFAGEYSKHMNRVFAFQSFTNKGALFTSYIDDDSVLILNPETADEYVLTARDRDLIRELLAQPAKPDVHR